MSRKELIAKLRSFNPAILRTRGSESLIALFVWFFENVVKEDYELQSGLSILNYLPKYAVDAIEMVSNKETCPADAVQIRDSYLREVEEENLPLLTEVAFGSVRRALLVASVARMLGEVTGYEFVKRETESYCFSQDNVLMQYLYKFLKEVGFKGMLDIYNAAPSGCSGTFGQTEIRILGTAGRLLVTFARRKEGKTTYKAPKDSGSQDLVLDYIEESVTFIGDDSEPNVPRWGTQSCYADFRLALEMIDEVITNWPATETDQKRVFKTDQEVSIGF